MKIAPPLLLLHHPPRTDRQIDGQTGRPNKLASFPYNLQQRRDGRSPRQADAVLDLPARRVDRAVSCRTTLASSGAVWIRRGFRLRRFGFCDVGGDVCFRWAGGVSGRRVFDGGRFLRGGSCGDGEVGGTMGFVGVFFGENLAMG